MTIIFDNQNRAQNEYVVDWLEVAWENAQSAVLLSGNPSLKKQALFHVQQSAETATKALALKVGMSYEDVKASGHRNLDLSGRIIDRMMDERHLKPFLGSIMPDDTANESLRALGAMLRATANFKFRSSVQLASQSDVKEALDMVDDMNSPLEHDAPSLVENLATKVIASFDVSDLHSDNPESLIKPELADWLASQGKDVDAIKDMLAVNLRGRFVSPEEDYRNEDADSDDVDDVSPEAIIEHFNAILKLVAATNKVFLIGALAWPHHTTTRYPAPPDAPPSPQEAAQLGELGTQHYTDEIGVIRYVQELSQSILEAVGILNDLCLEHL